jgi:hypothetical protein
MSMKNFTGRSLKIFQGCMMFRNLDKGAFISRDGKVWRLLISVRFSWRNKFSSDYMSRWVRCSQEPAP